MAETIELIGLKELETKLLELPVKIARNALRGGVYAGAKVLEKAVRAKAPIYTGKVSEGHPPAGTLKKSIISKHIPELSNLYQQTFKVTVKRGKKYKKVSEAGKVTYTNAYYAQWVENGHYFVPKNTMTRTSRNGVVRSANWKQHRAEWKSEGKARFVPPHPFMRPAWAESQQEVANAITTRLLERIMLEAQKK